MPEPGYYVKYISADIVVTRVTSANEALRVELKSQIDNALAAANSSGDVGLALHLNNINKQFADINNKLLIITTIEKAIIDNPERAMSIPLLRKDINGLQENVAQDIEALRMEIGRIYDLSKWFIGLIATMAIGILGLAIGNFVRKSG